MLVPLGGAQTRNIRPWVAVLKRNPIVLELRHFEINTSSSARIVQLAKTKAIAHFLPRATTFSGSHFSHAQKLGNSNVPYYKTKNPVELRRCKTPSSYMVYNPMKLEPQKEREFLVLEYGFATWKPAISGYCCDRWHPCNFIGLSQCPQCSQSFVRACYHRIFKRHKVMFRNFKWQRGLMPWLALSNIKRFKHF